jgi:cytochrome c biogenesis protein CcdA
MKEFILISAYAFALITPIFAIAFLIDWGANKLTKKLTQPTKRINKFKN